MSAPVLYRKWRPQTFAGVAGQEHVTQTLLNALSTGRVSHAYLFCGPRGTGKTSMGRILAKAVNCQASGKGEPCGACGMCQAVAEGRAFDLIEIDAASNRGIDEIRSLREKVNFAPNEARYKVYIIDEVHMLTKEAFNALLKTLEEPPPHSIFVLATTEAHKLPATVISRCQRFDFRRVPLPAVVGRLAHIAKEEGFQAPPEALGIIARAAGGSLRDAINLLEQVAVSHGSAIDAAAIRAMLGIGGEAQARALAQASLAGDVPAGLGAICQAAAEGVDLVQFHRTVLEQLRGMMLVKAGSDETLEIAAEEREALRKAATPVPMDRILRAVRAFGQADLKGNGVSSLPLELALVEAASAPAAMPAPAPAPAAAPMPPRPPMRPTYPPPQRPAGQPIRPTATPGAIPPPPGVRHPAFSSDRPAPPPRAPLPPALGFGSPPAARPAPAQGEQTFPPPAPKPPAPVVPVPGTDEGKCAWLRDHWRQFVEASKVKGQKYRLDSLLRSARPDSIQDSVATFGFTHKNFVDMMNGELDNPATRKALEDALERVIGKRYQVRCVVTERPLRPQPPRGHLLRAAVDEMGGKPVEPAVPGGPDHDE